MRTQKIQDNIRLVAQGGNEYRRIYLVEEAPGYRLALRARVYYRLPLPWIYYLVVHNKRETRLRMFGHNSPVKDNSQVQAIYCSPKWVRREGDSLDWLPIVGSAPHQICNFGTQVASDADMMEVIHKGVDNVWATSHSGFFHRTSKLQAALSPSLKQDLRSPSNYRTYDSYAEWEKKTVEEVLALDAYECVITLGDLVNQVTKNATKEVTRITY